MFPFRASIHGIIDSNRRAKGENMFGRKSIVICGLGICLGMWAGSRAQPPQHPPSHHEAEGKEETDPVQKHLTGLEESLGFAESTLIKRVDDLMLFRRLEDVAVVDKVRYTGPPPRVIKNPTGQGAGNPVIISAYTFFPRANSRQEKMPLIVFVHGGVHGDFNSNSVHILRELIQQGYAVLAPEYRGSSGYGKDFWHLIDYGGLETEDVFAGRQWMLENYEVIDRERVGIIGWSHGGMITLMNLFAHPKDFQVGYAAVPVSDLVARMGYKDQGYRDQFSASYHIGKTAEEDVNEYRRRSPVWHAEKLQSPLLIHTTTNDEDVNVMEVESLIKALKAADKKFEHKIYQNAPGGHAFNRIDTKLAKESRAEVYRFLARYLNPPNAVR
jgi:dipeptidyl aminopeptidase/acylaminoacyl peptidase